MSEKNGVSCSRSFKKTRSPSQSVRLFIDGVDGEDGADGHSPVIEIIDGYWYVDGENTGILAAGTPGRPGADGQDGAKGDTVDNNEVVTLSIAIAAVAIILGLAAILFRRVRRRSWWCTH